MKRTVGPWIAAIFCAFLSTMPLFGSIVYPGNWWQPAYYAFLPMCFYYAGMAQTTTNREVDALRTRLAALEVRPAA